MDSRFMGEDALAHHALLPRQGGPAKQRRPCSERWESRAVHTGFDARKAARPIRLPPGALPALAQTIDRRVGMGGAGLARRPGCWRWPDPCRRGRASRFPIRRPSAGEQCAQRFRKAPECPGCRQRRRRAPAFSAASARRQRKSTSAREASSQPTPPQAQIGRWRYSWAVPAAARRDLAQFVGQGAGPEDGTECRSTGRPNRRSQRCRPGACGSTPSGAGRFQRGHGADGVALCAHGRNATSSSGTPRAASPGRWSASSRLKATPADCSPSRRGGVVDRQGSLPPS